MRALATLTTALAGVALLTWGVVELLPGDLQAEPAPATATPGGPAVRAIRFRGDVEPLAVLGRLRTHVGAPLDRAALASDRALVEASLVAEGHLDASVACDVTDGVDVACTVDAGPVYRTGSVALVGSLAKRFPALGDELTLAQGDDVSPLAIERTEQRISTWLAVHGVTRSSVTHRVDVDRAQKRVDVTYTAELAVTTARR